MKKYYTYILSNRHRTVLYVGVTNDIRRRMLEHKSGIGCYFSSKYCLTDLLLYEEYNYIYDAIAREKQLKNWHREWKWALIKKNNLELKDLSFGWFTCEEREEMERFRRRFKRE